jgi:hypothetical protein
LSMTRGPMPTCLMARVDRQVTHGNKVECPAGVVHSALQSSHFGNRCSKCLDTHDVCCATTSHYRIGNHRCRASSSMTRTTTRRTNQMPPHVHGIRNIQVLQLPSKKIKITVRGKALKSYPTFRFAPSPNVGLGATVGTLQIGYPCIQDSS